MMDEGVVVGRDQEKKQLNKALNSKEAELIGIYGRRRVGKTHLVKILTQASFEHTLIITGLKDGQMSAQIDIFTRALEKTFKLLFRVMPPKNWMEAFELLTDAIEQNLVNKTIIIFLDELPWLATPKSDLLQALDHYWNTDWCYRQNVKCIVCGSAASWMLDNIINAKGGLHNRLTAIIHLRPFTLHETEKFLTLRGIFLNHKQLLDLYMVMGGIPYYLKRVERGLSAMQNINNLCFSTSGILYNEFNRLYASLFDNADIYEEIIREIAKSRYGIDKEALLKKLKLSTSGGTFSKRLMALEQAGFIISFTPYGYTKKGTYYRVIDEYSLFYLTWIEPALASIQLDSLQSGYWSAKSQTSSYKVWSGYAFEAVCYKHIDCIRKAMQITMGYEVGTWRYQARAKTETGAQIDLLFDRDDGVITLCEIKYSDKLFRIDKQYASELGNKIDVFQQQTKTKKQLFLAMLTVHGLFPNLYVDEMITHVVTLDDFFVSIK